MDPKQTMAVVPKTPPVPATTPPGQLLPPAVKDERVTQQDAVNELFMEAYKNAGKLEITPEENTILDRKFEPHDYDIKPTGEVFLAHIKARKRLTEAFGRGKWAPVLCAPAHYDKPHNTMLVDVVLIVKGTYVGRATGGQEFFENNSRMTYDDAIEGAISNALNRLCGKGSLGIGAECWEKDFCEAWKKDNATYHWHKDKYGNDKPFWFKKSNKCPNCFKSGEQVKEPKKEVEGSQKPSYTNKPAPSTPPSRTPVSANHSDTTSSAGITQKQINQIYAMAKEIGWDTQKVHTHFGLKWESEDKHESLKTLTESEAEAGIDGMRAIRDDREPVETTGPGGGEPGW